VNGSRYPPWRIPQNISFPSKVEIKSLGTNYHGTLVHSYSKRFLILLPRIEPEFGLESSPWSNSPLLPFRTKSLIVFSNFPTGIRDCLRDFGVTVRNVFDYPGRVISWLSRLGML
jgi:hypothetical protein